LVKTFETSPAGVPATAASRVISRVFSLSGVKQVYSRCDDDRATRRSSKEDALERRMEVMVLRADDIPVIQAAVRHVA